MNEHESVPNIRFKGFEDEWKNLKLGELSEIARGASPRPINNKKWFSKNSKIGWLRISDVTEQNGRIFYLKQKLSIQGQKKTRVIKTKHLLLSIAATVGSPVINYIPTGVHDGFLIFYNPKFDIEFMFQWLQKYRKNWSKFGQPGSQVNLNSEIVRNQKVYIPEEKEEREIANLFLKIDRLLDLQQQKIESLELLKKALLKKLFPKHDAKIPELRFRELEGDWRSCDLGKIAKLYQPKTITQKQMTSEGYPVFGANGFIGFYRKKNHSTDQVTISARGENAGVTSYVLAPVWITGNSMVINVDKNADIDKHFLFFDLSSINLTKFVTGGAQPQLTSKTLRKVEVLVTEIKEQQKIGNLLSKVDQVIELENKKLENLQQFKKCLLQNMFVD